MVDPELDVGRPPSAVLPLPLDRVACCPVARPLPASLLLDDEPEASHVLSSASMPDSCANPKRQKAILPRDLPSMSRGALQVDGSMLLGSCDHVLVDVHSIFSPIPRPLLLSVISMLEGWIDRETRLIIRQLDYKRQVEQDASR